jgi:pyruvate kinase
MATRPFRRTKIIATIGPATESEEMLTKLIAAGADIMRINMAHASHEWVRTLVNRIRTVTTELGREVGVMMDIKGPEIRTGPLPAPVALAKGDRVDFVAIDDGAPPPPGVLAVSVNYPGIVNDVKDGATILVDNGLLRLTVLENTGTRLRCTVEIGGTLGSRRHINLPGIRVDLPSITEKDYADTLLGIDAGVDFFAQSFVRRPEDIQLLRDFLVKHGSRATITAKIEDQEAVANLDEIVGACDSLMVARGDLGVENPAEELPILQRRAVMRCIELGKPVIIATHMLESMIENPVPTRAEVSDVANSVFEEADCIMLSGETTTGKYPVHCVEMFDRIARRMESIPTAGFEFSPRAATDKIKLTRSAILVAEQMPAVGILAFTRAGSTARNAAALRPRKVPVFAVTDTVHMQRQLKILRAVEPFCMALDSNPIDTVPQAIAMLRESGRVSRGDKLVILGDHIVDGRRIDSVELRTVD